MSLFDILNGSQFEDEINEKLTQALLNGADVNARDSDGWTILHRAVSKHQLDVVKLLVESGADIDALNGNNLSASHLAVRENNWSVLKWLVEEHGVKIPLTNEKNVEEVEAILKGFGNTNAFFVLNDQTDAVLILGKSDSSADVLTKYFVKHDAACGALVEDEGAFDDSTVKPEMILPMIMVDDYADVVYYGSSNFGDAKNRFDDMTSWYFLKKIIDYVEGVKLVFSVNYNTVKNQKEFLNFLDQIANFIVDLRKYDRSVSLVVTKTDDHSNDDDEGILEATHKLIEELKKYIQGNANTKSDSENLIKLLDVFLTKRGNNYDRLGVFRVSKLPGKIVSKYTASKSVELIARDTIFALKDADDFRYLISDNSKALAYDLTERINIGVTFDVINIANELQKYYNVEVNQSNNLHKLQKKLNAEHRVLSELRQEIILSVDPAEVVDIIVRHLEQLKISISGSNLKSIKRWGHRRDFLQAAVGQKFMATPWNWVMPISEVSQFLEDTHRWYEFLSDLYDKFSTYEIQVDKAKYNVANLGDWGKANANGGINIDRNNWSEFMSIVERYNVKEYAYVKDKPTDKRKLRDLNHVLDSSFKQTTQFSCVNLKRVAKGHYVFLSDVLRAGCYRNAYYEVFALKTIFVDIDLNQCNLQGVIVAPNWEIIQQRVLGLNFQGLFLGIGESFTNGNNLAFSFTKGENLERINLVHLHNHTGVRLHRNKVFTKSMSCIPASTIGSLEQVSHNVEDYKSYMRDNLNDFLMQQPLIEFVKDFEENSIVVELYDTLGFVRELQELENHFFKLSNQIDFLPFYQSLLKRMSDYTDNLKPIDESPQRKSILTYVYTAVLSKITNLKYGSSSNLVIDIKEYLDLAVDNIKTLGEIDERVRDTSKKFEEINKKAMIEELRNNYKSEIDKKIEEANYFISTYILPEIDKISAQLQREMDELLKEIDEIKRKVEKQKEELEKLKRKIEREIRLRAIFGFIKILGSLLSFFGPIGAIAGAAVNAVASVAETTIPDSSEELNKLEMITLPEGIDDERKLKKRDVESAISGTGDSITSALNSAKSDEQKLEIVKGAIKKSEEQIAKLEDFKKYVRNKITPWLGAVLDGLKTQAKNLQGKSHAALDVQGWQVQQKIKDIKFYLVDALNGFKVQKNFKRFLEKLDDALTTLVNIFDRIQNYEDQKRLADYIADISSVQFSNLKIDDVRLANTTNNLERVITSNILLGLYDTALNNFKQFTFPFADYYLEDFSVLSVLSEDATVQTLADNAVSRLGLMKSALTKSSSTINKRFDKYIHRAHFNIENKIVGPFYVWNNNDHRETILALLGGEEVALKADVMQAAEDRNAVKFDLIELQFRAINSTQQPELQSKLNFFEISMTHRGNSYYKCGAKFYVINTNSVTLTYSLQKGNDGRPTGANLVYEKLRSGDLLLSPYTMWTIKLAPTTLAFKELKKYANQIDLILIGHGQYLSEDGDVCDHDLRKYYQVDETISEINFIDADGSQVFESGADRYTCASSGSSFGSPINNLINWFLPVGIFFPTWSLGGDAISHVAIDPVKFYNQVDSGLALAPVLLHLWNSFFKRPTPMKTETSVEIEASKARAWENILTRGRELVDTLETSLGLNHSQLMWYADALETRKIEAIKLGVEATSAEVNGLEKNLVAFCVDLRDDLVHNRAFGAAKGQEDVQRAVEKLAEAFVALPNHRKLFAAEIGKLYVGRRNLDVLDGSNHFSTCGITDNHVSRYVMWNSRSFPQSQASYIYFQDIVKNAQTALHC